MIRPSQFFGQRRSLRMMIEFILNPNFYKISYVDLNQQPSLALDDMDK